MPKFDIINCKTKDLTMAFSFALLMASESTIVVNISIFEELNICQLGLLKDDL